jgi:hypothetical protein
MLNPLTPRSRWLSPELPEWDMEKYRFYLDLPGDFWEGGQLMKYLRERQVGAARGALVGAGWGGGWG